MVLLEKIVPFAFIAAEYCNNYLTSLEIMFLSSSDVNEFCNWYYIKNLFYYNII
jgi:hypothetical protein